MVDRQEVERVAENARIKITDEEAEKLVEDFENILGIFEKLQEVDTEDIEPAFHPVDVEPETRDDVEEECLAQEQVFANTDNVEDDKFKGPSA